MLLQFHTLLTLALLDCFYCRCVIDLKLELHNFQLQMIKNIYIYEKNLTSPILNYFINEPGFSGGHFTATLARTATPPPPPPPMSLSIPP